MYFNNTKNRPSHKGKGFTPQNPGKTPGREKSRADKREAAPVVDKYNLEEVLKHDKQRCAEIEAAIEVVEILTAIPEQIKSEQDLLNFLKERDSYLDKVKFSPSRKINHVMLTDRPRGKNLLENLSPEYIKQLTQLKNADEARRFQEQVQSRSGFTTEVSEYKEPICHDFRHVIRMEFNGRANKPDEDSLSEAYLAARESPLSEPPKPQDYNLEAAPAWQFFKKFPNFRNMEADFRNALTLMKIPPEAVAKMNSFDFEDALFNYKSHGDEDMTSVRLFEGAKEAAVKIHARNHRKELEKIFKGMNADPQDIKNMLDKMEKQGQIPPLRLPNGDYLSATVHHDKAILDAGDLEDPTQVNNPKNFRIIFKLNKKDNPENQTTQIKDKDLFKAFNDNKIEVDAMPPTGELSSFQSSLQTAGLKEAEISEIMTLNALSSSPEAKQEFIKKASREKMAEFVAAFRALQIDDKKIVEIMTPMMQEGRIPQINLSKNRQLALELRRTKHGLRLNFGVQEKSSEYTDAHRGIFHGNSTRPVYIELTDNGNPGSVIVPHEGENNKRDDHKLLSEKDIYAIETAEQNKTGNVKKMSMRVRAKLKSSENAGEEDRYPAFFVAGTSDELVIWSNNQDIEAAQRRAEALNRGISQFQYGDNNYGRSQ